MHWMLGQIPIECPLLTGIVIVLQVWVLYLELQRRR